MPEDNKNINVVTPRFSFNFSAVKKFYKKSSKSLRFLMVLGMVLGLVVTIIVFQKLNILPSFARQGDVDLEAESGQLNGLVSVGEDSQASGGTYIEFGASTGATPGPTVVPTATPTPTGDSFYVSCLGSDNNDGVSEQTAWKSLSKASSASLKPGDRLLLHTDCEWQETLSVNDNGTEVAPILIGSYGEGSFPVIRMVSNNSQAVRITGTYNIVQNIQATADAPIYESGCENNPVGHIVGFAFESGSHNNILRGSVAEKMYAGVYLKSGSHDNEIIGNIFKNNIMMNPLDGSSDNDAGAFGILVWGDDNAIANNTIYGSNSCSYDYGRDGGAVEIYGGQRNRIHHNIAYNNDAFTELGNSRSADNEFAYNLFYSDLDSSIFMVTRGGSSGYGPVSNTKAFNNTVYLTGANSQGFVCHAGCGSDILTLKNNIFYAVGKAGYADAGFNESNNLFWGGPLQFSKSSTSIIADPRFEDVQNNNFNLLQDSPARDAGIDVGYSKDLSGTTVPQGSAVDIGAYEF